MVLEELVQLVLVQLVLVELVLEELVLEELVLEELVPEELEFVHFFSPLGLYDLEQVVQQDLEQPVHFLAALDLDDQE